MSEWIEVYGELDYPSPLPLKGEGVFHIKLWQEAPNEEGPSEEGPMKDESQTVP